MSIKYVGDYTQDKPCDYNNCGICPECICSASDKGKDIARGSAVELCWESSNICCPHYVRIPECDGMCIMCTNLRCPQIGEGVVTYE